MADRPRILTGRTTEIQTGCGPLYVTESEGAIIDGGMYHEINCIMGKSGGCQAAAMAAVSGLLTLCRTARVGRQACIKVLRGISCPNVRVSDGIRTLSCFDAIAIVLAARDKPLETVPVVETPEEAMMARPTGDLGVT
jgi:ribonucleoside-diphosphate reductase alpha chain